MTRYYLDSTAHIERWAGTTERQTEIATLLGTEQHATSLHSLREWKSVIERSCADVLNALLEGSRDFGDLFARLSKGFHRTPGQRQRAMSLITGGETVIDVDEVELRAEALVRYQARLLFHSQIDTVRNGSECFLAENMATQNATGRWVFKRPDGASDRCKKDEVVCRQDDDLGGKLARFEAAVTALAGSPDHKKDAKVGAEAVAVARERKGKNCYSNLGDVSIALECRADEVLLTTDASFEVMAPALGITVHRLP